jgi:hypothetical protein
MHVLFWIKSVAIPRNVITRRRDVWVVCYESKQNSFPVVFQRPWIPSDIYKHTFWQHFWTSVHWLQNTSFLARHCNSSHRKPCCPSSLNIDSKPPHIGRNTIHWTEPRGTPTHGKSEQRQPVICLLSGESKCLQSDSSDHAKVYVCTGTTMGHMLHVTFILTFLLTHLLTYSLTYCKEQSPSWEDNRFSASQEIPRILWKPKFYYGIYNCLPPVPIPSQLDPVHTTTTHFLKIQHNIIYYMWFPSFF